MELKTIESDVASLCNQYNSLQQAVQNSVNNNVLLSLSPLEGIAQIAMLETSDVSNSQDSKTESKETFEHKEMDKKLTDYKTLLLCLISWRDKVLSLQEKADKFRKRLQEKDAITGATRYGEKTALRVSTLLSNYEVLLNITYTSLVVDDAPNNNGKSGSSNKELKLLESILQEQKNLESDHQKQLEIKLQMANDDQKQIQLRKQREEEERLAAAVAQKKREDEELAESAEALRRVRTEDIQRARNAERDFMNSIVKGEKGVKIQLDKLKTACTKENSPTSYKAVVQSLHSVYSQILSHPEEVKHRKIRRDHPVFMQDIGQHEGGVELLIASGFRLEVVDDIPCLYSKEPDIENDMERWSDWFDLLKLTLELIENQMLL